MLNHIIVFDRYLLSLQVFIESKYVISVDYAAFRRRSWSRFPHWPGSVTQVNLGEKQPYVFLSLHSLL